MLTELPHAEKGGKSLHEYLSLFKSICNQLSAIGKPVSDVNKVFRLLEGHGDKYESFKTTMLHPQIPSFAEIVPQLQSFELCNKKVLEIFPIHPWRLYLKDAMIAAETLGAEDHLEGAIPLIEEDAPIKPHKVHIKLETILDMEHLSIKSASVEVTVH
ncbi:hypothetical protein MLD38_029241 [Melastoma candidum]|uniref:Uncharacterized protein n=1 Tax=Melastoma candidum TaxID=119954 RepID=A0ACB9N8Z7_9MYRT|nr:hypothetical protein MLD38_029241 [Melastoma candidum]